MYGFPESQISCILNPLSTHPLCHCHVLHKRRPSIACSHIPHHLPCVFTALNQVKAVSSRSGLADNPLILQDIPAHCGCAARDRIWQKGSPELIMLWVQGRDGCGLLLPGCNRAGEHKGVVCFPCDLETINGLVVGWLQIFCPSFWNCGGGCCCCWLAADTGQCPLQGSLVRSLGLMPTGLLLPRPAFLVGSCMLLSH